MNLHHKFRCFYEVVLGPKALDSKLKSLKDGASTFVNVHVYDSLANLEILGFPMGGAY